MTKFFFQPATILCYDGDDSGDTGGTGNLPNDPPGGDGGNGGGEEKRFTQADLNKILAEDKRKHQERYSTLENSYQELLQNQNLTTEERDTLKSRLEDVQKSLRTKEQQAEYERKQAEEKYQNELKTQTARASHWENLFKQETIARSLQDAAGAADAFNSNQIVGLLRPFTELKDQDGKLTPMVDFPDIDEKTGEEVSTLRTPMDAVKRMRELPKVYGNLFKSNVVSGVGAGQGTGPSDDHLDYANMDAETYRQHRAAIKKRLSQR